MSYVLIYLSLSSLSLTLVSWLTVIYSLSIYDFSIDERCWIFFVFLPTFHSEWSGFVGFFWFLASFWLGLAVILRESRCVFAFFERLRTHVTKMLLCRYF